MSKNQQIVEESKRERERLEKEDHLRSLKRLRWVRVTAESETKNASRGRTKTLRDKFIYRCEIRVLGSIEELS